jgi:hypothetical protein
MERKIAFLPGEVLRVRGNKFETHSNNEPYEVSRSHSTKAVANAKGRAEP